MWKRYGVFIFASAILSLAASYCLPDEYAAQARISDEYKVTDLAVGLNFKNVLLRDLDPNHGNNGTDDIEVYARMLSDKQLFPYRLGYNISINNQTVDIQVLNRDPKVAVEQLNATLNILKREIEHHRQKRALIEKDNAMKARNAAGRDYHEAMKRYAEYADSHQNPTQEAVRSQLTQLKDDYELKHTIYEKASLAYVRADYLTQKANTSFVIVKNGALAEKPLYPRHWVYALTGLCIASLLCMWHWLYKRRKRQSKGLHLSELAHWFAPWTLSLAIWALILGLYYLQDSLLYPITEQFYFCLALWLPIFCLTAIITYCLMDRRETGIGQGIDYNKHVFNFFFIISMVITPLYVYRILQIVMMFSTDDLLNNIRTLAVYGEGQGFLGHSSIINQALFVVALWGYPKIPVWKIAALALACLANSFAIMEKGTVFFVFICIIFTLFEKKIIRLRSIAILGVFLILIFYVFNLARAGEDSDYQKEETLIDFFAMYALSPPVAFCQVTEDVTPQFGTNTFETIYLYLTRFGMDGFVVKQKLQEFVWVPIPTNVYTIFQPFYIDFGLKGIAFFAAIYGVVCGWLYRIYRNGQNIGICLYTYIVYALILQFYQENVFLSMAFVIEFTLIIVLTTQRSIHFILKKHTPNE